MDIQVDITEEFYKSYKKIPQSKRKLIGDKINQLVDNLRNGNKRSLIRPRGIEFPANIKKSQSTLYIFRVTPEYRAIVSLDEDQCLIRKCSHCTILRDTIVSPYVLWQWLLNFIDNMKIHKLKDDNGILAQTKEILLVEYYEDLLKTLSELEDNECYVKRN